MSATFGLVLFGVAAGASLVVRLTNAAPAWRLRRRLRNARSCTVAQLVEGTHGCVVGKVRGGEARLRAPFSGRLCVYYLAEVAENITSDSVGAWTTVISEQQSVLFRIEDRTGSAVIDATGAELAVQVTTTTESIYNHPRDRRSAFVERHREATFEISGHASRLRYHEAIIENGQTIVVSGTAIREIDPEAAAAPYRGDPPTRIRMVGSAHEPLAIGDGRALPRNP